MKTTTLIKILLSVYPLAIADDSCNEKGCDPKFLLEQCTQDPSRIIPHEGECQIYYDCSVVYENPPRHFEQYLVECPYPQLFSEDTLQCEHYSNVNCGGRKKITDKCEYRQHQCGGIHCYSCHLLYPSCFRKKDGVHAHPEKSPSPNFIICKDGRLVKVDTCGNDPSTGRQLLFQNNNCI